VARLAGGGDDAARLRVVAGGCRGRCADGGVGFADQAKVSTLIFLGFSYLLLWNFVVMLVV